MIQGRLKSVTKAVIWTGVQPCACFQIIVERLRDQPDDLAEAFDNIDQREKDQSRWLTGRLSANRSRSLRRLRFGSSIGSVSAGLSASFSDRALAYSIGSKRLTQMQCPRSDGRVTHRTERTIMKPALQCSCWRLPRDQRMRCRLRRKRLRRIAFPRRLRWRRQAKRSSPAPEAVTQRPWWWLMPTARRSRSCAVTARASTTLDSAHDKAYTGVTFKSDTMALADRAKGDGPIAALGEAAARHVFSRRRGDQAERRGHRRDWRRRRARRQSR